MRTAHARVSVRSTDPAAATQEFADDVRYYLSQTPRQLPSRYFYDALGSALFDAICQLPWYRVTRAELALLAKHAPAILGKSTAGDRLVELGPGNGEKLATLLAAGLPAKTGVELHLVDVSGAALATAARGLSGFESLRIVAHEATYESGLRQVSKEARVGGRTLVLFLGSNIGNFDPDAAISFLRGMRATLRAGDRLLLGADLRKPEETLLLAYDDPLGVTAAFNLNLLLRLNRELDASIDLNGFRHEALWNKKESRVEMHLVSTKAQRILIPRASVDLTLREGDRIWTESSYKYEPMEVTRLLARCGFSARSQWVDTDARFALTIAEVE
ncbi:MAG: L-histidine N(alpha)-methyltransferase [Vicinamibacteria bacterium]|nr:L-histidine N(alpha)-methyltransferase [Vicinamibacteria bacterium]